MLKIALIAPGLLPIPSAGAVENLIYEYETYLRSAGHEVKVFNTQDLGLVINQVNNCGFDIVHLHYDRYYHILPNINTKCIVSSHYPYINDPTRWYADEYHDIFNFMSGNADKYTIFAVSEKDKQSYIAAGVHPSNIYLMQNGANTEKFRFKEIPSLPDYSVCLAQISPRKRQYLFAGMDKIDCIGRGPNIYPGINYKGEVPDEFKYNHLTDYGNMVLVSQGENGTPMAIKEALAAGLGVVVSEGAAHELPRDLPFIRVLSELEIHNQEILKQAIDINRIASLKIRKDIREWASKSFEWKNLIKIYEQNLYKVLDK